MSNEDSQFDSEKSIFHQQFSDFEEEEIEMPKCIGEIEEEPEEEKEEDFENAEIPETEEDETLNAISAQIKNYNDGADFNDLGEEDENCAVKKYIVYVSKDYVSKIDSMTTDERSAYINDAIQLKIDSEHEKRNINKAKIKIGQLIVIFVTICLISPFALYLVNKSIIATFNNYKYSQDNFEKLYKQKLHANKIYTRSLEYKKY